MRFLLIFLLLTGNLFLSAQTKKIAFKSHSGSIENFQLALNNELFNMDNSNFGRGPEPEVVSAELDSIIFVSDSVAVMVTSQHCKVWYKPSEKATLWKAGKDTLINHPLFSHKHSLDSIRKTGILTFA